MKKTLLFLIAATAMMMTGCSNDDFGGATQGMTLNATVEQPASRATMTGPNDGSYKFSFTGNDKLYVTNSEVSNYYTFTKNGETFTSTNAKPTNAAADWYAYFPGNTVDLTNQNGDLDGVAKYYACAGKTESATTGADGLNIRLTPQVAILRIKVDGIACDIQVSDDKWVSGLEATKGTTEFTVTTSNSKVSLLTKPDPGTYYIAVPAGVKIAIYNGGTLVRATKDAGLTAGKYYNLTTGPVSGTAEATINGETKNVGWVQLWAGGPKFATQNVDGTMTWSAAVNTNLWGDNWRLPCKEEMSSMCDYIEQSEILTTKTVKVKYCQQGDKFGFEFTGVQPGYTENSIFLPTVGNKHDAEGGFGIYWTSDPVAGTQTGYSFDLGYGKGGYLVTYFTTNSQVNTPNAVRLVLK